MDPRRSGLSDRLETVGELWAMIRERRQWVLLPVFVAIVLVVVFVTAAEMPVLIPFFYAVF
ncbi:MAG: hypothetical protein H6732_00690 [Alphaproteobacteria bacterium]|nr:hypothetical protein [Alphaproteobacteria bacterium]